MPILNSWEQSSFTAIEINNNIAQKKFLVPQYQRGLVWKKKQRDQFVDTLKRGLPFGTVLLYHDEDRGEYQIIDGLQRCTTIYNFINQPAPFFNEDDIDPELPLELAQIAGYSNPKNMASDVQDHLTCWVHTAFRSMDDVRKVQYVKYAQAFVASFPLAKGKEFEIADAVGPTLSKFKDLCDNLCTIKIPAIIIKGDDSVLPEIFERINSKGMQLSKYQIYAATWQQKYKITQPQLEDLIEYNKKRYEEMSSNGADIVDFDSIQFAKKQQLNLFEIAFALGKKLGNDYPSMFTTSKDTVDVDGLGFSLITSCLGERNANSKNLYPVFCKHINAENINLFLTRIIQCVKEVEKMVGKYNKFKLNAEIRVGPLHTDFQIISLIANIFISRYAQYSRDGNDRVEMFHLNLEEQNGSWKTYRAQLKENAWKKYCLDILNERWKGSGDKRLDAVVFDTNYYGQEISWDDFSAALRQWFSTQSLEKNEHKKVASPKEGEKVFLSLLYLPVFNAEDQIDGSKYDVEHLATKNQMRKRLDFFNGELKLPLSSIGNLCLLPQAENRSKKDKTIYEDKRYLAESKYTLADLEEKFTFTSEPDLKWLSDISLGKDKFKAEYMAYIGRRFEKMLDKIRENYFMSPHH